MISPLVSIVVTAYQSDPQELSEAIESALGQSLPAIEIIISDDSASDRVREVAESFQDARIRYRANPYRLGVAVNHAIAFAESRGKYIAILNHDDRWAPNLLAVLVPPLEQQSHVVLSFCDHCLGRHIPRPCQKTRVRPSTSSGRTGLGLQSLQICRSC